LAKRRAFGFRLAVFAWQVQHLAKLDGFANLALAEGEALEVQDEDVRRL
jgi:hypothetical protein